MQRAGDLAVAEPVPHYFFDLLNDVDAPDPEGKELPDLGAAIDEALKDARELIAASVQQDGTIDLRHHINIRGENGDVLHTLWFDEALTVRRDDQTPTAVGTRLG